MLLPYPTASENSASAGLRTHFQAQITSIDKQMWPLCYWKASALFLTSVEINIPV